MAAKKDQSHQLIMDTRVWGCSCGGWSAAVQAIRGYGETTADARAAQLTFAHGAHVRRSKVTGSNDAALEMALMVKAWWQEHCADTYGPDGEGNIYSSEPPFVAQAKAILGDWENPPLEGLAPLPRPRRVVVPLEPAAGQG